MDWAVQTMIIVSTYVKVINGAMFTKIYIYIQYKHAQQCTSSKEGISALSVESLSAVKFQHCWIYIMLGYS